MKKLSVLFFILAVAVSGCVIIKLPGVEPLREKTVGGKGADKVVLIDVSGIISDEDISNLLGVQTGTRLTARIKEELDLAQEDKAVKAVVLRIDSPGGAVATCDTIVHEIKGFKAKKKVPVVAQMMDVAASGGYYLAAASDKIMAQPTTVTGSIGVIAYNVNAKGLLDKIGVADQTIKSGDHKDIGSPLRAMTAEERDILQSIINGMYERFIDVVMEGRAGTGLKRDELVKLADGRIYTAAQARDNKLIDGIGYLDDAIEEAKKAAGIKEARIITYAAPGSYRNNIYSGLPAARAAQGINLVNIDPSPVTRKFGLSFMYLWMP